MDFRPAFPQPGPARAGPFQAPAGRDRPEPGSGRRGKTTWLRIERHFKPNFPPDPPNRPPRPPRTPPGGLEKLHFFLNPPGGVWGGLGVSLGLWGPVWLEKLVDSRTRRLFPTTGWRLRSISASWGLKRASSGRARLGKSWSEVHLGRRVWPVWSSSR